MKIDKTVLKETGYIAAWVLILSGLMQAVFLVIGKWDYTVLLGNLLIAAALILNFLLMGITVQNAVQKDEKDARAAMKVSQTYRMRMMSVVVARGAGLRVFNTWAVVIPVIFPRLAVAVRPLFEKNKK